MGFLKKFFKSVFHEQTPSQRTNSFEQLGEAELEAHLKIARYGDFVLTEAVRPSYDLKVVPKAGYRHDCYEDDQTKAKVPVLMAAASKERVFDTFIDLLGPLGHSVDVVLETSHHRDAGGHVDLYREQMDMPVLKSLLYEFEDLLTNDGCTGIAVLNPGIPQEVQLDEHKLLIVYGRPLERFEMLLEQQELSCVEEMRFITEAEHVHSSSEEYYQQFLQLKNRLGMDEQFAH